MKQRISFVETVQFCWGFFKRFPLFVFLAYFCITLNILAELLHPLALGWLVDYVSAIPEPTYENFVTGFWLAMILVFQGVFYHLTQRGAHFLNCYTDSRVERLVAAETLDRVQHFSADWHANAFAGSIVTKIKRAMRAVHDFYDIFCYDIYPVIGVTVGIIILVTLRSPVLGLIFFVFSIFYTILSILLATQYVAPKNREANLHDNYIGAALADTLSSNATVKSFAGEQRENTKFGKVSYLWMIAARWSWIRGNIVALTQAIIINGLKFVIMGGAVYLWYKGTFTPGDVAFMFSGYGMIMGYLRTIGDRIRDMNQAMNDMEDTIIFHQTPIQVKNTPGAKVMNVNKGEIEFKDISFEYPNQTSAVYEDFSLTIQAGQKIALVGHSGSGKSTFVKLLQRLYDVQKGEVVIDGQNIAKVTQESLRDNIALVPQDPILFHRSLAENIAYGKPSATMEEIEKAAKLAHAHEFIDKLPNRYDTLVGERGIKLSGGERQRVAIARAILADCPILVLDEATSSLDSESEKLIQDALHHLLEGRTSIIVAHRFSTIKEVDRILVFEEGEIIEDGSFEALIEKKGTFAKLWELQKLD